MKKNACILICLLLTALLLPPAFALEPGEYTWQGHTIRLIEVQDPPMFAPADMKNGDRALGLRLEVPEALAADQNLSHALYKAARLTDADGQSYKPGAALAKDNVLTYLFAVPKALDVSTLRLSFEGEVAAENSLKTFVGDWEGQSGDIHLSFSVHEDGSGRYAFDQAGYHESYAVQLNTDDHTFTVDIPKNNTLSIVSCKGTWQYEDDVLTLNVVTTFAGGRQFKYSIPCKRVDEAPADDLNALFGAWSEADARFAMHNGVTWTSAPEDIAALIGETNLQRQEMPDGKGFVLGDKKALVWKGCEINTLYFFQQEKLSCVVHGFVHSDEAIYEALCGALAEMYGEPNMTDFSRFSACAASLGASPDDLRGLEAAPWRAWLLPDQNTLVFAADQQGICVVYLNMARLQAQ